MKLIKLSFLLISTCILSSCLEDFNLGNDSEKYTIVIEATVTNIENLTYVKVTKSSQNFKPLAVSPLDRTGDEGIPDPITDAVVVISDDLGNSHKLTSSKKYIVYRYIYDKKGNKIDSVGEELTHGKREQAIYRRKGFKGQPGRTYYLQVKHRGKEYRSQGYMQPIPPVDSAKLRTIIIKEADGSKGFVPTVFFKDPLEKNYYFFDLLPYYRVGWTVSIMDDRLLEAYVKGFNINDGYHVDWWRTNYQYISSPTTDKKFIMASISREVYEYYYSLISQFNHDGGAYSPTPASPVSNISNGALGVFRVSDTNIVKVK